MGEFQGKRYLVTGAGQGFGYALAKRLSNEGAKIIAVSLYLNQLEDLKKECPTVEIIALDLRNWTKTRQALSKVGELDGLVNNAGVTIVKPFEEFTEEEFDYIFDVNIKSTFNVTQVLSPKLKTGSSIVNISSMASRRSLPGHTVYSASKSAVDALTRSLALEFGERKIRVNTLNPTAILTEMGRQVWSDPKVSEPYLSQIPLHRFGEVDEAVNSIVYLLSNQASFINGHHLLLDGGYSV